MALVKPRARAEKPSQSVAANRIEDGGLYGG